MKTNQDFTTKFRDYADITVPKGTKLTHRTAMGIDKNYHFVDDFKWIAAAYPEIDNILKYDMMYYGIDVPKEFVDYE